MRVGGVPQISCLATYYLLPITYITLLVFFSKDREVYVTFRMCFEIQHQ